MGEGLSRKDLLRSAALLGGAGALAACTTSGESQGSATAATASGADAGTGDPVVRAGEVYDVQSASGVRAGIHGPQTGRLQTSQRSFKVDDAYRDPGQWFFYYDVDGMLLATRNFVTRTSGKSVCYSLTGFRTARGPQLTSSLGLVTFDPGDQPGDVRCHVMATNYFDAAAEESRDGQQSSPYFASAQVLRARDAATMDSSVARVINSVIDRTAEQLGLDKSQLQRLAV